MIIVITIIILLYYFILLMILFKLLKSGIYFCFDTQDLYANFSPILCIQIFEGICIHVRASVAGFENTVA